ncbi:MAG: hypothetical protein IJ272_03265 [Clostridia bacterium]|nr:hypothetical protein [Clostridia bacterium]
MKNKLIRIFLAFVVALPMFTSVLAISAEDLLDRLDGIAEDIEYIKGEYEEELEKYSDVVDSLSDESKATIEDLLDGLILEEGMETRVDALKAELEASTVDGADGLLSATEGVEDAFYDMLEDNKDIVEEVKGGYSNLTTEEVKQVVEKTVEIVESLGLEVDTTETYDDMMKILDDAHSLALDINIKLEAIIPNYVATFEDALTLDLVKELLTEVKAKDREAVIDTLIEALDNANGGAELKGHLKEVKKMTLELKDKLMELDTLPEQDLLMFTDDQKTAVSNKVKAVEKDYVDFAKTIIDNCAEDYMDVVINLAYDVEVDTMIDYANEALDYYAEYKDTIDSLTVSMFVEKLPANMKDLAEKAGLMVALGFVDTSAYNKDYITNNFGTQIDNISKYLAEEIVDYLDHIDAVIEGEVMDTYQNGTDSATTQNELRTITAARFTTLTNLKALKTRVDKELLANHEDVKADLAKMANYVYTMYNENILLSVSATLIKENSDAARKYECAEMDGYILTNKFIPTTEFTTELGIPTEHSSVVTYANTANSKIRTASTITIKLSEETLGMVTFAVLGDIYADGLIDARDYMMIKNYIMDGENISKISLIAADTYRDKLVDARDYMMIKNYIMDGTEISL